MPRKIEYTSAFKKDFKREKKGVLGKKLDRILSDATDLLAADTPLPARYEDHQLSGDWKDFRDCHLKPDLILIYQKSGNALRLVRLGSHSELGI